ncbi:MAG: gamma-glutamylcyclotransferase [Alphaproteobacteria bacterium]|nr:gamma-glutamylcyclotransferase [Alphaproteobacteria bacterium]
MADRKVQVFFYGSFISLKVLEEAGLKKRPFAPACVHGYELVIQPHANLVEGGDGVVYGILANMTHAELDILYNTHIKNFASATYRPEAMMVFTRGGKMVPALVYISSDMKPGFADNEYVDKVLKAATSYGFPKWYLERIEAFKS